MCDVIAVDSFEKLLSVLIALINYSDNFDQIGSFPKRFLESGQVAVDMRYAQSLQNLDVEDSLEVEVTFDLPMSTQSLFDLNVS